MGMHVTNLETELQPTSGATMQKLSMDNTVKELAALDTNTTHVFYTVEAGTVRVTFDGTTPSASNGHLLAQNASGFWTKETAEAAKFWQTATTVVNVSELTS
jgi:hypothetical protein